jgi:uncharacterized protein DUF3857/transglutaminase superfamily protein
MKPSHKTPILLAASILAALLALSGNTRAKDDWLPIPPEDLALKDNPLNPGAHAMILYRENSIDAKQSSYIEYDRIKIFTEEGKKWGDVEVQFNKNNVDIKDVRARTIRPDGSVVDFQGQVYEKEIVKAGGIKYLAKTFSLPEVQPGCIVEYKYRAQYDTNYYVNIEWPVQSDLFTRLAKFSITPDTADYAPPLYWREYRIPGNAKPEKQKNGSITMEVHNLPGLEPEDYMPPQNFLRARIAFLYRDRNDPQNETPEQFWKRMDKAWDAQQERFVDKKKALEEVVAQTVSPNDPPEVKLRKLYDRVQQIHNTMYDRIESAKEEKRVKGKENNNVEDVLKHGSGDNREINYVMIGLARAAGFESSRVYIAPRNNNAFYPTMEDVSQLQDDIVWVKLGNQDVYIDPAAKFYGYPTLPWSESGVTGIRVDKQGGTTVTVPLSPPSDSLRERRADMTLDDDGTLSGKLEITYLRQWSAVKRQEVQQDDEAGKKKDITDEIKTILPGGATFEIVSMTGWDKNSDPVHIEATVKIPGYATAAGHRVLVPLTFFQATQPASFQSEKRINSIYFDFPEIEKDTITIHMPLAYKIETLPAPQKAAPGGGFEYSVTSTQSAEKVTVERQLTIAGIMFPAGNYTAIRTFFNTVKTNDDGQIVLQPAQVAKGN